MAIDFIKNPNERNDPPRPLLEHLMALRDMLVFGAIAWAICCVVALCFAPWIQEQIASRAEDCMGMLQCTELTEPFWIWMSIGAWGGTALAFPFIIYAILRFVFPALTKREKFVILFVMSVGTVLFLIGASLAYAKTLPLVVKAFQEIAVIMHIKQEIITLGSYIPVVLKLIVAFGLVFQVPLIVFVLGCLGIVSSQALREKRRIAIVMSFILAMFLTPPDPMSQVLMAVPLCLLYELSIWAVWLKEKGSLGK